MALPANTEGSPLSLWPGRMVRNAGESYASDLMLTRSEMWTAREGERGALLSAAMKTDFNNEGDHSSWLLLGLLEEVAELKREREK